jgi:hypothetical protein
MFFASLPYELRSHIWSLATEPRRITKVRVKKSEGSFSKNQRQHGKDILYETTSTRPPALMHACRESRQHAPYQRAFTAGIEPRWTWVNFQLDIFCVSSLGSIADIVSHRSEVQRLHIRTDDDHDWYESATNYGALRILDNFVNLREFQVALGAGGHRENISFVDEGSGLLLTGPQLRLVNDWRMFFSFDSEGNPPDPDRLSDEIEDALDDTWHLTMAQMREMD